MSKPKLCRGRSTVGLKNGRIDWSMMPNAIVLYLANHGFHASVIAKHTGLTVPQVHFRIRYLKISLRSYRNGETVPAVQVIRPVV